MRKVIISVTADVISNLLPPGFFDVMETIEGKAILKLDIEKGVKIAVCGFAVKDGFTLEDVTFPPEWTILDVLKKHNSTHTCLLKTDYNQGGVKVRQLFDEENYLNLRDLLGLDIILDLPFILSEEKMVVTFTADNRAIKKLLEKVNLLGTIEHISFQPATFSEYTLLSCLTERQKQVITTAKKSGYYDVPRKTSTEELSEKLGISRATTIEHLRKAEHRIISSILAGY
jgi:predicted DNA binding protein